MHERNIFLIPCVWLLTFMPAACGARSAVALPPAPDAIRLQPGDAVRLALKDEPELAGEYPVESDGTVLLPLAGLIRVAREPFDQVAERVRHAYAQELTAPVVVLVPLMRVAVSGEARTPGVFMADPTFTWAEVLARAGGVLPTGARNHVVLVRDGREYELRRDGAAMLPPVPVRPGDRLVVPRRGWLEDNLPVLIGSATSVLVAAVTTLLVR